MPTCPSRQADPPGLVVRPFPVFKFVTTNCGGEISQGPPLKRRYFFGFHGLTGVHLFLANPRGLRGFRGQFDKIGSHSVSSLRAF